MFITDLFIIIKNWEQPKYPSTGWINLGTVIQWKLPTIRKNKLLLRETKGMNLKWILWRERQSQKATYCMLPFTWHSGKGKTIGTVKRSVVTRWAKGWGSEGLPTKGCVGGDWWQLMELFHILIVVAGDGYPAACFCQNSRNYTFKKGKFSLI